jgi:hypothetical protein
VISRIDCAPKVENHRDLTEASALGFFPIALNITVCGHCEDADQAAAGPEQVQRLRKGGGPDGVQDGIDTLSRPVMNASTYTSVS